MMIFAMVTYTALLVSMNLIVVGGGSNLFPLEMLHTFTPEQVKDRIKGSKIVLVSEQAMLLTIWSLKACMLTFYHCLTFVPRPPPASASQPACSSSSWCWLLAAGYWLLIAGCRLY